LIFHDVLLLKESLAASLTAVLLYALTREELDRRWWPWLGTGVVWGLVSLLRENAVLLLPILALLIWIRRKSWRGLGAALGGLLLGFSLVIAPFVLRSLALTGSPLPTHNAGFNFYIGNNPEASGTYRSIVAGKTTPEAESREPIRLASRLAGGRLTPQEASRFWLARSLRWMAAEPGEFLLLQLRKLGLFWRFYEWPDAVDYYWIEKRSPPLRGAFVEFGALAVLAVSSLWFLRRRLRLWAPILLLVVGWTLATIAFFVFSRFRIPMLPALCLLAGVPLVRWYRALSSRRRAVSILGGLGIAGALLFPHLLGFEPNRQLVAYNLGGIYSSRDQPERARTQYLIALDEAPENPLPLLRLGDLAFRGGDLARAVSWYRRATEVAPDSDDAWALYGRSLVFRGRFDEAREPLERSLSLNRGNITALHGLGLLALTREDLDEARRIRNRIRTVSPGHPAARHLAARIETRQENPPREPPGVR
ncbi:MAG: tetratricopeptide repeat protein, partial [Thermoanaerobaculia bacterium]|nr:tetratricopeptide repeat protein [Thermoanaerobaculia bacterium]